MTRRRIQPQLNICQPESANTIDATTVQRRPCKKLAILTSLSTKALADGLCPVPLSPVPLTVRGSCSSIGSWSLVLELTSYAATITSALLFAFTGDFLANRRLFARFLLFIAYECLLVAVKVAYQLLRDTPPFEVKLQRKRVNFLQRKIVADEPDERKEDSDDEESDDEVRHPLIVHDRDPEQNLEALRDPSRYRQNLA